MKKQNLELPDIQPGMFDLGNGEFCTKKPNSCFRSIIGAVDPDKQIAYGLCPVRIMLPWCLGVLTPSEQAFASGAEQTEFLLAEAEKLGIKLPAARFCHEYQGFGVNPGEAFLPTKDEISHFGQSAIMNSWKMIGLNSGDCTMFSSTMNEDGNVWMQSYSIAAVSSFVMQQRTFGVIRVIKIKL